MVKAFPSINKVPKQTNDTEKRTMKKTKLSKRIISFFLCLTLLASYLPLSVLAGSSSLSRAAIAGAVTDPGTADSWENMLGTAQDGNRYAGRVWVDKSVYKDGDVAILNSKNTSGSHFSVDLEDDEDFQVIFSALGSTMTTKESTTSTGPMDVVLVLDTSTSMDDEDRNGVTRLERTITAANSLLDDLLTLQNVRIAIVTYNNDSETVIPLAAYTNGIELVVTDYYNNGSSDAGVVTAYDNNRNVLGKDDGYTMGTNLQSGIDRGFNILANATGVSGRIPVAIVLTDGQANRADSEGFYELSTHSDKDGTSASGRNLYLSTLLNAAYNKTKIEENYGKDATVYSVGVDITNNVVARLLMNPADPTNGFNARNANSDVKRAYEYFQRWANGETVTYNRWTFDHNYPTQNGAITDAKIAANINYADTYYDVSNADIADTFEQIYEELSSGVFNPISSTTITDGATGVAHTPLIYVDFIGQYMEIKEIQSVTLFGASYGVIQNANGTYTVDTATGTNPTTNEAWNTRDDILISVTEEADGTQKLEIRINQEILPIILEQAVSETVGNKTTATIYEFLQDPLRIYYTIGVDSDILLPSGQIDVSKIQNYRHVNAAEGTVSFYSNRFGVMNPANANVVTKGDAHVGFKPSLENRYYYHQTNQGIFTKITDKTNGSAVTFPSNSEYGILWDESKYGLTWMSYAEYLAATDNTKVYTYVSYYHPTPDTTDAQNAAEEVTYLVYTDWKYLKESVAFFDANSNTYLNGGNVLEESQVASTVSAYLQANPKAKIYAVLGIGSHRTSRLHNMTVAKTLNNTETAAERYTPEYTYDTATLHNGNDVVVWLGNNGKLTVKIDTGIALTKRVTEAIGNPNDTYALTVTVPSGVVATPKVVDAHGNTVQSTYSGNVLTVQVKADETVYISGIPGGTQCQIGEVVNGDYFVASKTDTVTVPLASDALNGAAQFATATVTNAPNQYGNLFITKEITSDHNIPAAILDNTFSLTVNLGAALTGKTFTVEDSAHNAPYNVTVDSAGNLTFDIKARQTVEILQIPAGTPITVTESDPGSHFNVTYRTRNHSGENADADNALIIPQNGSATAVVLNHYTPSPVSVDLDIAGTKDFRIEGAHSGGTFTYKVQKWNGTAWEDISGKTAETSYAANEKGTKTFTIDNVLAGISFTEVGRYSYQVLEVKGNVLNVTYDRTLYAFDVTITDNGGQLVATVTDRDGAPITDGSYEVTFVNTYHTVPVSLDVKKIVENRSGDTTVSAAGFEFKAVRTDAAWSALTGSDAASSSIFSDAAGNARFTSVCTKPGTYYFVLSEVNRGAAAWTYSAAEYRITVTVIENSGELTAELKVEKHGSQNANETASVDPSDATKGSVSFVNVYDPEDTSINLDGKVIKELSGMTLKPDQFTFYVYADGDRSTPILVGTNNLNGDVHFVDFDKALIFTGIGKFQYDVVEAIPTGAVYNAETGKYVLNGMSYDPTIYDLVVEVVNDTATGKLIANSYFEDAVAGVVTFRNSYKAVSTQYELGGTKILHGRAPKNGEFTFELYEGTTLKGTTSNKADGSFRFAPITYTEAGTYTYTIKEVHGSVAGIRYDGVNSPVSVTVTVTDTNGVLSAAASLDPADVKFENTYAAMSAKVSFNGSKTLAGGTLADGAFTFKLYQTDLSFDITSPSAVHLATALNAGSVFSFARELDKAGTYYFVVVEDGSNPVENIVYDRTAHRFSVQVTDSGYGQLMAVVINMNSGAVTAASADVSVSTPFVNATFEEVTEKEVFLAGNTTTQIDGKKVSAGDILTYYITYTNYTGETVVADIMDTIPNHTTYVDGSASHGGTYVGSHVNWILNVAKDESVTVSFDVKVNEEEAVVANTAVIRDGINTYHTNEVVNHTVEEELKKDVFFPANTEISIDGKKVYEGDELLYTISFTNASTEAADLTINDVIPANTTYVEGSADNGGVYAGGAITWTMNNVPAWSTVVVTFKVTVNSGIGAETIQNQATAFDGVNHYTTDVVTNYTVKDNVEKKVALASEPTVNIDGKAVEKGEVLVYTISYKNTSSEKASVTIEDTVPAYTYYVDGSADNGGSYAGGVITWNLEVDPGSEVTVSFKVKVDGKNGDAVLNKATVLEGKNTYTTNSVSNTVTVEEIVPPGPQTGDRTNLILWFTLLFVSGSGVIASSVYGKTRKEEN